MCLVCIFVEHFRDCITHFKQEINCILFWITSMEEKYDQCFWSCTCKLSGHLPFLWRWPLNIWVRLYWLITFVFCFQLFFHLQKERYFPESRWVSSWWPFLHEYCFFSIKITFKFPIKFGHLCLIIQLVTFFVYIRYVCSVFHSISFWWSVI